MCGATVRPRLKCSPNVGVVFGVLLKRGAQSTHSFSDMPHMAQFVFDCYSRSVEGMREVHEARQRELQSQQVRDCGQ